MTWRRFPSRPLSRVKACRDGCAIWVDLPALLARPMYRSRTALASARRTQAAAAAARTRAAPPPPSTRPPRPRSASAGSSAPACVSSATSGRAWCRSSPFCALSVAPFVAPVRERDVRLLALLARASGFASAPPRRSSSRRGRAPEHVDRAHDALHTRAPPPPPAAPTVASREGRRERGSNAKPRPVFLSRASRARGRSAPARHGVRQDGHGLAV